MTAPEDDGIMPPRRQSLLVLNTGREVRIERLEQRDIYRDRLEGLPAMRLNDGIIRLTMRIARGPWWSGGQRL